MRDWRADVRSRLAALDLGPGREAEIVEELTQHLESRFADLRRSGMDETAATAAALAELDEPGILAAALRPLEARVPTPPVPGDARRARPLDILVNDVSYALRSFRSHPTFAAAAILTFALGIGGCVLIFSAVQGVIRRPLPFPAPDRLVALWGTAPEKGLPEVAQPVGLYAEYRDHTRTLTGLAAYGRAGVTLTGVGEPERVEGGIVSRNLFQVLGVPLFLGRSFTEEEAGANAAPTVVLSYALWQRKFAGDSGIVGRTIELGTRATTVIGVMPRGFDFPERSELWAPLNVDPNQFTCWCWNLIGRLRPALVPADLAREMSRLVDDFDARHPGVFHDHKPGSARFVAVSLTERIVGNLQRPLLVLLGAVGLVLLIACTNIANLVLARASTRQLELAVRCCLGASPGRVAAQLLTETVLLAAIGSAAGVVLAGWGIGAMRRLPVGQFPRIDGVRIDPVVLAFAVVITALAGLLCGIVPALRVSRLDLQEVVKGSARASLTGQTRRLRDGFVVTQVALCLVLLVGAGLLLRSYRRLSHIDLGYRPESVLVGRISLPFPRYDSAAAVRAFYLPLLDRLRAIPGAADAALADRVPLTPGNTQDNVVAEGKEPRPGEPVRVANMRVVTPGYFRTIGTPLLAGRDFQASDDEQGLRVGVVDETFARHFWPGESPLGKRFYHSGDTSSGRMVTVVGVVRNVKHNSVDENADLQVYESFDRVARWGNYVVVRSSLPPEDLAQQVRAAVRAGDPMLPVYDVHTMQSAVQDSLSIRRLMNLLLAGFALTALLLAAVGIYSVISLGVTARIREFGIRLALGAQVADVRRQVLRHGLWLATLGLAFGLTGAAYVTRFLRRLLYGVTPVDWPTFGAVAAGLLATAMLASWLPARRATRADPITALRSE